MLSLSVLLAGCTTSQCTNGKYVYFSRHDVMTDRTLQNIVINNESKERADKK